GDVSLVPDVGYPSYSMGARLAGGDIYWLPVDARSGYLPDVEAIPENVIRTAKLLWINYPNNPTGAIADMSFYKKMITFCKERDILLGSDNPYVDVTFDGYKAPSALEVAGAKDCTVEFMSCSKTYNMGGWRLAAAVGNANALKTLLQVKSNVDSGHFRPIYDAGIVALDETSEEWINERNCVYQNRRDRILEVLPEIGLEAEKPKGSLYIWAKVLEGDGMSYADEALQKGLVALAPGSAYGPGGSQYVRMSLGVPEDRLSVALERLKHWY